MRSFTTLFAAMLVATACQTTAPAGERGADPENIEWSETIDIRLDERAVFDSRALEIQPIRIGIDQASLFVRVDGLERTVDLRTTGPLGSETIPPYRIELLSTSPEPTATVRVSRSRGRGSR